MPLDAQSRAVGVGAGADNTPFQVTAENVPSKNLLIATYDPAILTLADNVPLLVLSPEDVADRTGQGFPLHRLAIKSFAGSSGIETWIIPQPEDGGAVQAAGEIDFTGSAGVLAGTLALYIHNVRVPVAIVAADTAAIIATKTAAAINADNDLGITAAANLDAVDITAKAGGTWGNDITILFNLGFDEALPTGVVQATTPMATGATNPDISDALNGLGVDDDANEALFTHMVHGYGQETAVLDAISTYVGEGNELDGLYDKLVARPFTAMTGDTDPGSAALTALIALTDLRKLDRANSIVAVPDAPDHPSELAALTMGEMSKTSNNRPEESFEGIVLSGVRPGDKADRWTSDYDNRDLAVKSGISPTKVENGVVILQNVVTFYRPDAVPVDSNGYRSVRNISIIRNVLNSVKATFSTEKWQGISIVADVSKVTNITSRQKARSVNSVIDELLSLARLWENKAWIYTAAFTIERLKATNPSPVVIRDGSSGFDATVDIILSGEGGILDTLVRFDTSIAVLTA